jgi:hypothetical protein
MMEVTGSTKTYQPWCIIVLWSVSFCIAYEEYQFIFSVCIKRIWQEGAQNMLKAKVLCVDGSAILYVPEISVSTQVCVYLEIGCII